MTERSAARPGPVDELEIDALSEEALEAVAGGTEPPRQPGFSSQGGGCCSCHSCSHVD
ncbi:MAG TPA: hypothetical protein VHG91_06160 [Longimicrobium sp.]|nr:hypothetical protein [Longimicrobium sp.]